jgi:hypothetical protein
MHAKPLLLAMFVLAIGLVSGRSIAQGKPTLSGTWSASAMVERWNVGDWGAKCGPRPGGQGAPGGSVTISQLGSELSINGAGRSYSTTNCWEQAPGLRRVSHSAASRGWSNRCTTAANDPRRATVITTMSATDDAIYFDETGSYQFVLEGQNCTASVRRTRSFKLVRREGEAPPAATASAPPAPTPTPTPTATSMPPPTATSKPPPDERVRNCDEPGEPARLEVRPARKLIRPGEHFAFRAVVVDASGCMLTVQPAWRVAEGDAKIVLAPGGKVTVAQDSPEGTADILVTVSGKNVRVTVEVATKEHYESLLEARGLNASGEAEEAAVAVIATGSLGGGTAVAEDTAKKRKTIFAAVVGGAALLLALVGFVFLRRGAKKKRVIVDEDIEPVAVIIPPAPPPAAEPPSSDSRPRQRHEVYEVERGSRAPTPPQMVCPVCRGDFPAGGLFCPLDGTRLVKASGTSEPVRAAVGGICPTCERGFPAEIKYCPEHHELLVPAPLFNATSVKRPVAAVSRGKICPTCGTRYEGGATFCGKDGTSLVLVN